MYHSIPHTPWTSGAKKFVLRFRKNEMLNRIRLITFLACLLAGIHSVKAQSLIAGWDFQTTSNGGTAILAAPNTQTVLQANVGNGTIYLNGTNGSGSWTTATSGNQLTSFGGSNLNLATGFSSSVTSPACLAVANNTANGKAMVIAFSMTGLSNLIVSFATQRSSTGFTSQLWEYSTDATNWTLVQTVNTINTSFTTQTLPAIPALNNASTAFLRVTFNGATSGSGNNRIDNLQLNAIASAPVVTNGNATGTVGNSFSYFINATNSPASYAASGLPAGLSINTSTGEISGTPTVAVTSSSVNISANNSAGTGSGVLNLTINQAAQTLNFPSISTKTFGDPIFTLNATGGASGNPVLYASSNNAVASISGNTVQINGAGTCVITASQAGNANYLAAVDVNQSLTVNQAAQTISFSPLSSKLITDLPFTLNATGGASGNSVTYISSNAAVASITGNTVTINGAGITNITASQSGNINYQAAMDVTQVLEVNLLSQTITFNALSSKLITDPPFQLNATGGASGNPIVFNSSNNAVASIIGNTVTINGPGVTTITASQAGNAMYSAAANATQTLVVNSGSNLVTYNFGTSVSPTPLPTSGIPISNLTFSAISQGNNANTTQTSITLSTTSASNNSGASGEMNAGITARNRNFQLDSSAYFEFSITAASGHTVSLNTLNFNSRSTGTGPTTLDIRCSNDNFASTLGSISVNANSTWAAISPTIISPYSTSALTIRIYGYVTGGSGSINTGSSPNNWRIDDIKLLVSENVSYACNMSITATASPIICTGGNTSIVVNATNNNGLTNYRLNAGAFQTSSSFPNTVAGTYTINVTDAFSCTASTVITLNEPVAQIVTASNVSTCNGVAVNLNGFPIGGTFSIANPYTGPSVSFTYSYTDSAGCTAVSAPANVTTTPCAVLNLKLFLQSYYAGSGSMRPVLFNQGVSTDPSVVDYVTVELRMPNSFTLVASQQALLNTDGTSSVSFPNLTGNYIIVIKHRNGLQTWGNMVTLSSTPTTYNFTLDPCSTWECAELEIEPGVYAFYSGDINHDDNIDLLDLPGIESDIENFNFGYTENDLDGDGNVDLLDLPVLEDNISQFIFSHHPPVIVFPETMEGGSKPSYAAANINLSTGSWTFEDALIGTSSADRKNGAQSARLQNLGKLTMNFDVYVDSNFITIAHASYASEASGTWALFRSTNAGATWTQVGSNVSSSSTTLQTANFLLNYTGYVRFQIRKLSGGRLNIDDFNITTDTLIIITNDNDHIAFGNPSLAVTDISFPDNYLLIKPQFDLAYDNSKGSAAWVAWHLDINDVGSTPRCDCFATDVQLPSSFFRANSSNYTGTGFDRGHQVPSSHRNNNITNNAVTFLMSNIMPQAPNLNQITWNNLEQYCVTLINNGYELYTYSGGYGSGGTGSNGGITYTISGGSINVPSHFWKIVIALPVGNNDVNRVTNSTRIIAVDMPNTQTVNANAWGTYRTSIDAIESATGFDFLSMLPTTLQSTVEALVDNGPTN